MPKPAPDTVWESDNFESPSKDFEAESLDFGEDLWVSGIKRQEFDGKMIKFVKTPKRTFYEMSGNHTHARRMGMISATSQSISTERRVFRDMSK